MILYNGEVPQLFDISNLKNFHYGLIYLRKNGRRCQDLAETWINDQKFKSIAFFNQYLGGMLD